MNLTPLSKNQDEVKTLSRAVLEELEKNRYYSIAVTAEPLAAEPVAAKVETVEKVVFENNEISGKKFVKPLLLSDLYADAVTKQFSSRDEIKGSLECMNSDEELRGVSLEEPIRVRGKLEEGANCFVDSIMWSLSTKVTQHCCQETVTPYKHKIPRYDANSVDPSDCLAYGSDFSMHHNVPLSLSPTNQMTYSRDDEYEFLLEQERRQMSLRKDSGGSNMACCESMRRATPEGLGDCPPREEYIHEGDLLDPARQNRQESSESYPGYEKLSQDLAQAIPEKNDSLYGVKDFLHRFDNGIMIGILSVVNSGQSSTFNSGSGSGSSVNSKDDDDDDRKNSFRPNKGAVCVPVIVVAGPNPTFTKVLSARERTAQSRIRIFNLFQEYHPVSEFHGLEVMVTLWKYLRPEVEIHGESLKPLIYNDLRVALGLYQKTFSVVL